MDWNTHNWQFLRAMGETIHYVRNAQGSTTTSGAGRAIRAVVERRPPAVLPETGRALRPMLSIAVANASATYDADTSEPGGVSADELDTGNDYFLVPKRVGGTPVVMRVHGEPKEQDEGMLLLELR